MTEDSLKELLMLRICALEKLTNERFDAQEKALTLQAVEYGRRLDSLNTQHAVVCEEVKSLKEFRANILGKSAVLTVVISAGVSFIFVVLNYLLLSRPLG